MVIAVQPDGSLEFVYHDDFVELLREGASAIERASEVEPFKDGWAADIIGGPFLGPFPLRAEAIAAEVDWIEQHRLGKEANG